MDRRCTAGFTLIEVLIASAFLTLAITSALFIFKNQSLGNLESDAQIIAARLKEAQARAIAGANGSPWGIRFDNVGAPFYALFQGPVYAAPSSTYYLSATVEFQVPATATSVDLVFDKLLGTTATTTSIVIRLKTNTTDARTITVGKSGRIGVE